MQSNSQTKTLSQVLIGLSWLAIIFAIYGYVGGSDTTVLEIAPTQWMTIAATLGVNAIYIHVASKK